MSWWISQFFPPSVPPPAGPGFKRGANPFARTSQEPLDILESITPIEIASCVPFVKIEKIDRLGRPATDVRPLMYDLVQAPRFAGGEDIFGVDSDTFAERSLVSLENLTVEFEQQYGQQIFRDITMVFTVHQPAAVFDRSSKNSWREILMAGKSFTLEYGWKGDTNFVRNPLFNGEGHVTDSGQVLKSTQLVMLNVYSYDMQALQTGEVRVTVRARENGDLSLRQVRFSDAFEQSIGSGVAQPDDVDNVKALRALFSKLKRFPVKGKGEYFLMGDILDDIVAPMVVAAGKAWGYAGVDLLLGKFNRDAGPQADQYFGSQMADVGIENFRVPADVLLEKLQIHVGKGRALTLQNFVSYVIQIANADVAWAAPPQGKSYQKPQLLMKSDTVQTQGGIRLVLIIHDVTVGSHPFGIFDTGQNRIALDRQSREEVNAKLRSLGVPILEFARAGTLIKDASFNLQPDPLLQAIQTDAAYRDRKDRVQQTSLPDVESRKGQSRNGELIVPVSILEGDLQMHGNFALEVFGRIWIDFFGSKEVSGVFAVRGKTDTIEPGQFRSSFKVISEGIDPLNTRRRFTEAELAERDAADARKASKRAKTGAGSTSRSNPTAPAPGVEGTIVPRGQS